MSRVVFVCGILGRFLSTMLQSMEAVAAVGYRLKKERRKKQTHKKTGKVLL